MPNNDPCKKTNLNEWLEFNSSNNIHSPWLHLVTKYSAPRVFICLLYCLLFYFMVYPNVLFTLGAYIIRHIYYFPSLVKNTNYCVAMKLCVSLPWVVNCLMDDEMKLFFANNIV